MIARLLLVACVLLAAVLFVGLIFKVFFNAF